MTRQVYIYGLGGADKMYKVLAYHFITEEEITITNIVYHASMLKARNPSVETVYVIDNYPGLRNDCKASMYKSTIENCAIFKNIAEKSVALFFLWRYCYGIQISSLEGLRVSGKRDICIHVARRIPRRRRGNTQAPCV